MAGRAAAGRLADVLDDFRFGDLIEVLLLRGEHGDLCVAAVHDAHARDAASKPFLPLLVAILAASGKRWGGNKEYGCQKQRGMLRRLPKLQGHPRLLALIHCFMG